ncbi:MAG TPA: hypothetical protein VMH04_01615 [Candidatus Solibacter sp.]|nr:hypothetical protein [Candidatus Solibacter sp.]
MRQEIDDYLEYFEGQLQPDVPNDAREVIIRLKRENLLDFSTVLGNIPPAVLSFSHLADYASALAARGTDVVMRGVMLDDASDLIRWLQRRERPKRIGRYIGRCIASAKKSLRGQRT